MRLARPSLETFRISPEDFHKRLVADTGTFRHGFDPAHAFQLEGRTFEAGPGMLLAELVALDGPAETFPVEAIGYDAGAVRFEIGPVFGICRDIPAMDRVADKGARIAILSGGLSRGASQCDGAERQQENCSGLHHVSPSAESPFGRLPRRAIFGGKPAPKRHRPCLRIRRISASGTE